MLNSRDNLMKLRKKYTKNKNKECSKGCYDKYCLNHKKIVESKNDSKTCKYIFKKGVNKGLECGKICDTEYCKIHNKS